MLGKKRPVVVFQHYPPTSEQLRKFDEQNVHSVFTGHWHSERVVKAKKTISVSSPTFDMGGIDFSPAGFRVVDISHDGKMKTQWRAVGVSKWAKIVWPAGTLCKSQREIIANVYDSSIDAKKVNFRLNQKGQLKAAGELKRQSPLSWSAKLPSSIEAGDAEIEIEVGWGHNPTAEPGVSGGVKDPTLQKIVGNLTVSDCAAPAIKTAGDWPMFMGNPSRTGIANGGVKTPPCELVWSANTEGDLDLSSPILAEGKLYVAVKSRRSDASARCFGD